MDRRKFFSALAGTALAVATGETFSKATWEGTRLPKGTTRGITETAYLELAAMEEKMRKVYGKHDRKRPDPDWEGLINELNSMIHPPTIYRHET